MSGENDTQTTTDGADELDVQDAADALADLMDDDGDIPADAPDDAGKPASEGEGEGETGDGEQETPPADPNDQPPQFWTAEAREHWAKIPPEVRAYLREQDVNANRTVSQKMEEAARIRKDAEDREAKIAKDRADLDAYIQAQLPKLRQAVHGKWANVDWVQLARDLSPQDYNAWRAQYESDMAEAGRVAGEERRAQLERAEKAKKDEEKFAADEFGKLQKKIPDAFGNEEKATKTFREVATYLRGFEFGEEMIRSTSDSRVIEIAFKAMLWDKAQGAKAAAAANGKTAAAPKPVRPGAAGAANRAGQDQRQAMARLRRSGSVQDAASVLADMDL